jgi:hypothetical protein
VPYFLVAPLPGREGLTTRRKHRKSDARFRGGHRRFLPLFRAGVTWISGLSKSEIRMTNSNRRKSGSTRTREITQPNSLCTVPTFTIGTSSETSRSTDRISTVGLDRIRFKGYPSPVSCAGTR